MDFQGDLWMPDALLPGKILGHYQILAELGKGGMGVVYRARDLKLDRQVALKMLPVEAASDADRVRRFVQEAKAASAIQHPNVAPIYEIGEAGGVPYIAMELNSSSVGNNTGPMRSAIEPENVQHSVKALADATSSWIETN